MAPTCSRRPERKALACCRSGLELRCEASEADAEPRQARREPRGPATAKSDARGFRVARPLKPEARQSGWSLTRVAEARQGVALLLKGPTTPHETAEAACVSVAALPFEP
ncbi:hypothetical protein BESB_003010 [Besnoitia besnoiti]|uniref:Uncharacterized protein n=1 Tax=Besnoitia besnoiti TaxID=94643 RepID=A0A2A9MPX9_BESBE|nr:hypothetical protein BESB_003010 [Besnoitia besnoiti]PFH37960.1 hypothetical protein BESB_003010 [Besnoitia besnoiti]